MKWKSYFFVISLLIIVLFANCKAGERKSEVSLKDALKGKFLIGVAMNADQITGKDTAGVRLIKQHFNSITPENCMKSEVLQPEEGKFDFALADQYVDFGQKNNMFIVGHTLIWHSQAPKWFFVDKNGKDVSREVLIERMKNHITTVVGRYKGRVHGWDVVNEAIEDDGSFRKSKFYQIIGEDFIRLAFEFAHEADPEAELYYNDYSMSKEGKRDAVVKMVRNLQSQGVKIDGIGMQGHMTMDFPTLEEEEKSIVAFSETGVKVMITELDLTVLPSPGTKVSADVALSYEYQKQLNPYPNGLPDSVAQAAHDRYAEFFRLFLKHADKIDRVTMWGLTDEDSWRNNWPVPGRTDYPLLFDRNYQPKPIVETIIKEANQ
ncbi:MAG TPA: endo-1,4-beta-xylanase [Dysgonamonadaceae bacterium]|nr:endo-1,4-beta-xylanase [Dysgonamonadaceae bacterium]